MKNVPGTKLTHKSKNVPGPKFQGGEKMKLLLHTCCAPCSVYCIKSLREEGIEPTVYWFNPNIHPYMEYKARRDTLKDYTKSIRYKFYI